MEIPIKMDDLGVPPFLETPISWRFLTFLQYCWLPILGIGDQAYGIGVHLAETGRHTLGTHLPAIGVPIFSGLLEGRRIPPLVERNSFIMIHDADFILSHIFHLYCAPPIHLGYVCQNVKFI